MLRIPRSMEMEMKMAGGRQQSYLRCTYRYKIFYLPQELLMCPARNNLPLNSSAPRIQLVQVTQPCTFIRKLLNRECILNIEGLNILGNRMVLG